mmetsp:Transcript_12965/g.28422  ORF Transcript_12965/g.28422 Transcript_12965/m.28422 type:complete len:97 (-) Transcript_12965:930-1220(-)
MRYSQEEERAIVQARAREQQLKYWGPVAVAPIPYVCVTLYRNAKTPQAKQLLITVGMIGIPVLVYATRTYLMLNSSNSSQEITTLEQHRVRRESGL